MRSDTIVEKKCKSCGKNIDEKWDYCPYCKGKQAKIKCIFCKNDLDTTWKFCPYCKNKMKNPDSRDDVLKNGNDWLKDILEK
jgi:RNA polymerase subunit RPABC4/transcription elongation factor Spt4